MKEPVILKYPTEIFGHPFCDHSENAKRALKEQYCPFLDTECKKPRKSEPKIKVGVCSVGYRGEFSDAFRPVIVCPHRFNTPYIFETLRQEYLAHWTNIALIIDN